MKHVDAARRKLISKLRGAVPDTAWKHPGFPSQSSGQPRLWLVPGNELLTAAGPAPRSQGRGAGQERWGPTGSRKHSEGQRVRAASPSPGWHGHAAAGRAAGQGLGAGAEWGWCRGEGAGGRDGGARAGRAPGGSSQPGLLPGAVITARGVSGGAAAQGCPSEAGGWGRPGDEAGAKPSQGPG